MIKVIYNMEHINANKERVEDHCDGWISSNIKGDHYETTNAEFWRLINDGNFFSGYRMVQKLNQQVMDE